jgi:outer membrane protein, multidrug efflux system
VASFIPSVESRFRTRVESGFSRTFTHSKSLRPAMAGVAVILLSMFGAACAVRTASPSASIDKPALRQWDREAFSDRAYDPRWWRQFDDPVLEQLETSAVDANRDIRAAVARRDQARAIFDEDRRRRYPTAIADASVDIREQGQPGFRDEPLRVNTYRTALDASWELDLFGRVRAAIASASANAESFDAALADVRVSVAADVALNYFELRGIQQQLSVLDRSLANQRETLRLTQVRRDAGIGEEQDVASASARVSAIEAAVPPLRGALAAREHRLAVLIGVPPSALAVDLAPRDYPVLAKTVDLGPPDELLTRRPDVRAAERRLAAAAAREGVATADLYPRITISGMLGLLAGRGNIFGTSDSRAWAVTPALQWSAFDLGSARARLRGARAATQEVFAAYEQTMLLALEDAENALVNYRQQQERLVKLTDEARESTRAANIARLRFREGAVDFLALLDAERTQLQAEDGVAQAESDVFTALVGLYRAVGGIE